MRASCCSRSRAFARAPAHSRTECCCCCCLFGCLALLSCCCCRRRRRLAAFKLQMCAQMNERAARGKRMRQTDEEIKERLREREKERGKEKDRNTLYGAASRVLASWLTLKTHTHKQASLCKSQLDLLARALPLFALLALVGANVSPLRIRNISKYFVIMYLFCFI